MYYTHRSQYDRVKESVRYNAQFSDTLGIPSKTMYNLKATQKDPELSISSKGTPQKYLQRVRHVDRVESQDLSMVSGSHLPEERPFLTRKTSCNASMQPFLRKGQ